MKKLKKMAKEEAGYDAVLTHVHNFTDCCYSSTGDDEAGPATKAKPKPKPEAKKATRRKRGADDEDDLVVPAKKARLPSKGKNKGGKAVTEDEDRMEDHGIVKDEPITNDGEEYQYFT